MFQTGWIDMLLLPDQPDAVKEPHQHRDGNSTDCHKNREDPPSVGSPFVPQPGLDEWMLEELQMLHRHHDGDWMEFAAQIRVVERRYCIC